MVKTVADLNAEIDAQFADNHSRSITPAKQRTVLKDIVTNIPVTASQVLADAGTASNTTYLRGDNTWTTPPGSSSGITGGGLGFNFASLTDAMATSLDSGVQWFRTAGFAAAGDKGEGLYAKLTSDPAYATVAAPPGGVSGRNRGVPQTADGAFWKLVTENGIIRPNQFGAVVGKDYNDASLDQYPFFEDCIWFIVNQGYQAGLTMVVPPSWYYQSKPMLCSGGNFNIHGTANNRDNCVLWWPHTSHGVIVSYAQSGWITIDAEGGPYNGDFAGQFVGDTRYGIGADNTHVYICTVVGTPGGWNSTTSTWASPPTGTGSDIVDGTVHWAYQRELTRLEQFSIAQGRGGYVTAENISFYCGTNWQGSNIRSNHSGFVARNRSVVRNVFTASWPGCGTAFISDGDITLRGGGNSNGWRADRLVSYWNGMDGLHVGYNNSNAGTLIDGDFSANGRFAIANWCFLDNSYTSMEVAYDGAKSGGALIEHPHGCCYNGRYYVARMPIGGIEVNPSFSIYQSPTPDINSYWIYIGGDGTWGPGTDYPTFSSAESYEVGGGYGSRDINDRSVFVKAYVEGGTFWSQFMGNNLILGGLLQNALGGTVWNDRKWTQTLSVAGAGVNTTTGSTKFIQYDFGYGTGGGTSKNSYPKAVFGVGEYEGTRFSLESPDSSRFDQTDWKWTSLATNGFNRYNLMTMTTLNTALTFGTSTPHTISVHIPNLIVGDGNTDPSNPNGRKFQFGTAAPTSGDWARGDVIKNINPAVGSPKGWVCTVAGIPGTWVSEGNL